MEKNTFNVYKEFFDEGISFVDNIIKNKYCDEGESTWEDICERFLKTNEDKDNDSPLLRKLAGNIYKSMLDKRILPAGSILSSYGTNKKSSFSNCYYIPILEDSIEGINAMLGKNMRTFSWRGGCGNSIEILRPKDTRVDNAAVTSTGAVSFLPLISETTYRTAQNGRRGASIVTIADWHPDVLDFIECKGNPEKVFGKDSLTGKVGDVYSANISVKISDKLMNAYLNNEMWDLVFPDIEYNKKFYNDNWKGDIEHWKGIGGKIRVYKTINPKELIDAIIDSSYASGDPGLLYWDKIVKNTPLSFHPDTTPAGVNPCVTGDTLVRTTDGEFPIKEIVERFSEGQEFHVFNMEFDKNDSNELHDYPRINYDLIVNAIKTKENATIMAIKVDDKILKLTPDHKVWVNKKGYIEAKDIIIGDEVYYRDIKQKMICLAAVKETITDLPNEDVYDVTTAKNHNFFANSILVHNCGEQNLAPWDSCLLLSLSLHKYVVNKWSIDSYFDFQTFAHDIQNITIFADYISLKNIHPLKEQNEMARKTKKIGIEFTGFADMLSMLGLKYEASESTLNFVDKLMGFMFTVQLYTEINLVKTNNSVLPGILETKDNFEKYINQPYFENKFKEMHDIFDNENLLYDFSFVDVINDATYNINESFINMLRSDFKAHGVANLAFNTVGPTGTLSILADQCTSGIEPLFAFMYYRESRLFPGQKFPIYRLPVLKHLLSGGTLYGIDLEQFDKLSNDDKINLLNYTEANNVSYKDKILIQATVQKWITDSISNTLNVPETFDKNDMYDIIKFAWENNLKGITIFRDNCKKGVFSHSKEEKIEKSEKLEKEVVYEPFEKELYDEEEAKRYIVKWKNIKIYLNVVHDEDGNPLEVYAQLPQEAGLDDNNNFNQELYMERLSYWQTISRLISTLLRFSIPLNEVIKQLRKSSFNISHLSGIMARVLSNYPLFSDEEDCDKEESEIRNSSTHFQICPSCKSNSYQLEGGCGICISCGYSKCG